MPEKQLTFTSASAHLLMILNREEEIDFLYIVHLIVGKHITLYHVAS